LRFGIGGFVANGPEGVVIEAEGDRDRIDDFLAAMGNELPPLARIDSLIQSTAPAANPPPCATGETGRHGAIARTAPCPAPGDPTAIIPVFRIAATAPGAAAGAAIPADTAICQACLRELFDPSDRRYLHPFIACCDCGPRFTMTRHLPYDRDSTSMADFPLCPACECEYAEPDSRRFHAEPVACHDCGPRLSQSPVSVAAALAAGQIVAIKGIGGYHLACDARDHQAVARLRARKHRDGKPFALMVLNAACASRYVELTGEARLAIASRERPVVVLPRRTDNRDLSPELSPGLGSLGLLLPYTGVHYLLFHALLGCPPAEAWLTESNPLALVMTSANLSGDPLIADPADAASRLAGIADVILHHDREIARRADDSVVQVSGGVRTIIRRARGYTPHAIPLAANGPAVLALGAHLKTTVAMTCGDLAYLSAHVGDLDSPAAVALHAQTAQDLESMLQVSPDRLACDWSRDFASTRLAEGISEQRNLPLVRVQHHQAHAAAVLAEHGWERPALAIVLDGHGQGDAGESWGGELLRLDGAKFQRLGHFAPLPLPGGDRAAREPWRMAAGVLQQLGRGAEISRRFAHQPLAPALAQLLATGDAGVTTAAGRLFDAAAGLLGVIERATYEGEPPMRLEALTDKPLSLADGFHLRQGVLAFTGLLARLADCDDPALGASWLHGTLLDALVAWATDAASRTGIDTVALGGGCFLNAHLARELPARLERMGLRALTARALPPNDGAISLGQAWVAQRSVL
jgi:hydrogenase maturation protein HypF